MKGENSAVSGLEVHDMVTELLAAGFNEEHAIGYRVDSYFHSGESKWNHLK